MDPRATGEWRGVNQAQEGATTSTMTGIRDHMDNKEETSEKDMYYVDCLIIVNNEILQHLSKPRQCLCH